MIDFLVRVRCLVYNHASCIEDALRGFCLQETSFPFVCNILDDASDDGGQEVIERFVRQNFDLEDETTAKVEETNAYRLLYAHHRLNKNCYFAVFLLKYNHYKNNIPKWPYLMEWKDVKYVAVCEGDDYWIDSHKLQKQVDYLEEHPGCSFCGTNGIVLWENGEQPPYFFNNVHKSHIIKPEELIGHWLFPTASLLYRKEVGLTKVGGPIKTYGSDQVLALIGLSLGDVYAMSDVTCVYRRDSSNASGFTNTVKKKGREYITEQHLKMYGLYDEFTEGRFSNIIKPLLKRLKRRVPVYKAMNKSYLAAFLMNPFVFAQIAFHKIKTGHNV